MNWPVCKLQVCFNKFALAEKQKVNQHPKFDANFDIHIYFTKSQHVATLSFIPVGNHQATDTEF